MGFSIDVVINRDPDSEESGELKITPPLNEEEEVNFTSLCKEIGIEINIFFKDGMKTFRYHNLGDVCSGILVLKVLDALGMKEERE